MSAHRSPIDEAAEWLATITDDDCTPEERRAFARWLKRSNANVEEFLKVSTLVRRLETETEWPELDAGQLIAEALSAETNVTPLRPASALGETAADYGIDSNTGNDTRSSVEADSNIGANVHFSHSDDPGTGNHAPSSFAANKGAGARARTDDSSPRHEDRSARPSPYFRWPLVAAIVFLALTSLFDIDPSIWLNRTTYSTGLGELRSVILDDGSIVQLDAQSRIRTTYTERERRVELLKGAAIFHVARSPDRPFKVSTGFADIIAVGTAFNVSTREDRTVVTVMEGRVRVEPQLAVLPTRTVEDLRNPESVSLTPVELNPGQQAVIEPRKPLAEPTQVDPIKVTAWTARRLYFEDTPLADAVQEFSRYSPRSIRVEDPALAQRRITGTFDATDPASLVTFLERYGDARARETREGWIVEREP